MAKSNQSGGARSQIDKFREAARELETDDDEGRFDERLGRIARAPKGEEPGDQKPAARK